MQNLRCAGKHGGRLPGRISGSDFKELVGPGDLELLIEQPVQFEIVMLTRVYGDDRPARA
jgi:hypothetical protein